MPIIVSRCGPKASTSVGDLLLVEDRRHEDHRGAGVEVGPAALDRVGEVLGRVAARGRGANASVRALSTKSTPSSSATFMIASTCRTASASGFSWSSMLAPTTPRPMARRTVSAALPYPPSRSAVTGRSVASDDPPDLPRASGRAGCSRRPRSRSDAAIEWLAVASAVVPSTSATTLALITSQTLTTVSSVGSWCRRRNRVARAARSLMHGNVPVNAGCTGDRVPG